MIVFDDASLGYRGKAVVTGVRCAISEGDFVGVVGPNGSGKTTFLRTVLGLLAPVSGTARVDRTKRFAYVPQVDELNLLWPLTVREVVALAARSRRAFGRMTDAEKDAVEAALAATGLSAIAERRYDELSGGQRQRAILAQALSQRPDVLLLDEPTRGLDVRVEAEFLALLRGFNSRDRLTILFVTHTLGIPLNETGKILLFHGGTVASSTPAELIGTDRLEKIYGVPFVHGEVGGVRWASPVRIP